MDIHTIYISILLARIGANFIEDAEDVFGQIDERMRNISAKLDHHMQAMHVLTRQVMLQQFYSDSRSRTDGGSGIKAIRSRHSGTQNYFSETHAGSSTASIHDHANNIRTVGMGELAAVLNGIEFRTRHNDYRLKMPCRNSKDYHCTEDIPFPEVPPSVTNLPDPEEQIKEMREYFRAFRDQDPSIRDYEQYFKSILCYLEGTWTHTTKDVDESFESDRHFIDAKTWQELQEKLIYTENSGAKSRSENLALLPSAIMGFHDGDIPIYVQWNFRIMCHPLNKTLNTTRLRVVEDLASRMMMHRDKNQHMHSRAARFQINTEDSDEFEERRRKRIFLDKLMSEIPGKDNYPADIQDAGFETLVQDFDGKPLNAGYYHRWFTLDAKDAMGQSQIRRGYHDPNLFVAMTTNPKVAASTLRKCRNRRRSNTCTELKQRWSYAIPLEIIYLTPLASWNPYKIPYRGTYGRPDYANAITRADGRNGDCKKGVDFALDGTNSKTYYMTPDTFFAGGAIDGGSADTVGTKGLCFLDETRNSVRVRASGVRIFLPAIHDVGIIRTRYPIYPVHGEATSVWKELNALRNLVLEPSTYSLYSDNPENIMDTYLFETGESKSEGDSSDSHFHLIYLTSFELNNLKAGHAISKGTTEVNGHSHQLRLQWHRQKKRIRYVQCDGRKRCVDKHDTWLVETHEGESGNM